MCPQHHQYTNNALKKKKKKTHQNKLSDFKLMTPSVSWDSRYIKASNTISKTTAQYLHKLTRKTCERQSTTKELYYFSTVHGVYELYLQQNVS